MIKKDDMEGSVICRGVQMQHDASAEDWCLQNSKMQCGRNAYEINSIDPGHALMRVLHCFICSKCMY